MKWYLVLHFINLYLLPFIELGIMMLLFPSGDRTDMASSVLFGYIPLGCFAISVLYGMKKRDGFADHSFSAALLCIFTAFFPFLTGTGFFERLRSMLIIAFSYFIISLMGGIAGIIGYVFYNHLKAMLKKKK